MPTADGAAALEIVPLTPDRWDDVAALFGEGGDPKTCWCMYWRIRSKDWSFANTRETRKGFQRLVDEGRDPAPGLLAYRDGEATPVGWVSLAPRDDYERLTNSRVRPRIDDLPVWSVVCFVVSKRERGQGLTSQLLDAAMAYAVDHGAPGSRPTRSIRATAAFPPRSATPDSCRRSRRRVSGSLAKSTRRNRRSAG